MRACTSASIPLVIANLLEPTVRSSQVPGGGTGMLAMEADSTGTLGTAN